MDNFRQMRVRSPVGIVLIEELAVRRCNMDELKTCPFCGEMPVFSQYRKSDEWHILSCSNEQCLVRSRIEDFTEEKLLKRWNLRPVPPGNQDDDFWFDLPQAM